MKDNNWTIKKILEFTGDFFQKKGLDCPRLEAEALLAFVLGENRVFLYSHYEAPLNQDERQRYRQLIIRRCQGEPLAYITGKKEFMSLEFIVNQQVLIPRPETELLVETALDLIKTERISHICDVGTGSGIIPISLGYYTQTQYLEIMAGDISSDALAVAKQNALNHAVKIEFYEGDLLTPLMTEEKTFDLITANLPYVSTNQAADLDPGVKDFEPHQALFAGDDGLDLYKRLIPQANQLLHLGGYLLCEIDPKQAQGMGELLINDFESIEILCDLTGRERLVKARRR